MRKEKGNKRKQEMMKGRERKKDKKKEGRGKERMKGREIGMIKEGKG